MTFSGSVVAKMNFTCSGGSSTILSSALKPPRGDHVRLVDDEDLVAVAGRGEHRALAQVTGIVDAVVARGVDLDDIERTAAVAASSTHDGHSPHGVSVGPFGAVEAAGEDAG